MQNPIPSHHPVRLLVVLLLPLYFTLLNLRAHEEEPSFSLEVLSSERSIAGAKTFNLGVSMTALERAKLNHEPFVDAAPSGYSSAAVVSLPDSNVTEGQSRNIIFDIPFDSAKIPFTFDRLKIGLRNKTTGEVDASTIAYLYFTPYRTVEIWNQTDFEGLPRDWTTRATGEARIEIPKSRLPTTDLSRTELELGQIETMEVSVPGLPYSVARRAQQVSEPKAGQGQVFNGTVCGRVVTEIDSYQGDPATNVFNKKTLPIWDIKVELRIQDTVPLNGKPTLVDRLIGTTFTDEKGEFEIPVDFTAFDADLELSVKVIAENESETIRVRGRILNRPRSETVPVPIQSQDFGKVKLGDVDTDPTVLRPQLLHWSNKARDFAQTELAGSFTMPTSRLDIMPHPTFSDGGAPFFVPGGMAAGAAVISSGLTLAVMSNQDAVYMSNDRQLHDETMSHEFGHFLLWHMQGRAWLNLVDAGLASHSGVRNNPHPRLSWTEGFANGFATILQELNQDETDFTPRESEDLINAALTHGWLSEYYVGRVIYNLWDGDREGEDETIEDPDGVELSFLEIVQPILDHQAVGSPGGIGGFGQDGDLINHIGQYYSELMQLQPCDVDSSIPELLVMENIFNHQPVDELLDRHTPNSDALAFATELIAPVLRSVPASSVLIPTIINVPIFASVDELPDLDSSFHFCPLPGVDAILRDNLTVSGGATLLLQGRQPFGWQSSANYYSQPVTPALIPPTADGTINLCTGMQLTIAQDGIVQLGQLNTGAGPDHRATVNLHSGSTLKIEPGGTLKIENGSRFIVHPGADLICDDGAIELVGTDSVLEINGNWKIQSGSTFQFTGFGRIRTGLPSKPNIPNIEILEEKGGTVTTIRLDGFGKSEHIMLEVMPDTFILPPALLDISIEFSDGIVELGKNAFIDVADATTELERLDVRKGDTAWSGAGPHLGITMAGRPTTVDQVCVSGATVGITNHMSKITGKSKAPMTVNNSIFTNCGTGLLTEGLGVTLNNVEFSSNDTGWLGTGLTSDSSILGGEATGNSTGYSAATEGSMSLHFCEPKANGNGIGISTSGGMTVTATFGEVAGNETGFAIGAGSILDLSDGSSVFANNNTATIVFTSAALPTLEQGQNSLMPIAGGVALSGSLSVSCGEEIDATGNAWSTAGGAPITLFDVSAGKGPAACNIPVLTGGALQAIQTEGLFPGCSGNPQPISNQDSDGDGLADSIESYFGTDPTSPEATSPLDVQTNGTDVVLNFQESTNPDNLLTAVIEWSEDLVTWTSREVTIERGAADSAKKIRRMRAFVRKGKKRGIFFRVRVEEGEPQA